MNNINTIRSLSSKLLAEEAIKRGISVEHLNPYQTDEAFLELNYKDRKEFIIGQRISKTSLSSYWILESKELTKHYLRKSNVSVAEGKVFKKEDAVQISDYCKKIKYPVVVKPIFGSQGKSVFVGINNEEMLLRIINEIFVGNEYIIVEKEFMGKEYRFTASRDKVLGVTYREPANVVGDGKHPITYLIEEKNKDPRRGSGYEKVLCKIKIDDIVMQNLADQGLVLEDIIPDRKKIYLRKNSNLSTGGDSIDFTDEAHEDLKKVAIEAVRAIPGLVYGGVDLMSNQDISEKPGKDSYIIVEINSSPGISLHYDPIGGKTRDVAKEIIDMLYPETSF